MTGTRKVKVGGGGGGDLEPVPIDKESEGIHEANTSVEGKNVY